MEETGETLTGFVDYKIDLFDATTITQMLEHFQRLLESLVANPNQRLSSLPSLRETELVTPKKIEVEPTYVAPQKEIERTIALVWQEVLQIEKVGIHHNFFELGGQSLAIARVVGKLQEIFHRKISVVDLFQYPTIRGMSQYLSQEDRETTALKQIQNNAQRQKQALARRKQLMQQRTSR